MFQNKNLNHFFVDLKQLFRKIEVSKYKSELSVLLHKNRNLNL
ncbi:hypothetical protein BN1096_610005 [Clostridioides difficile]|uniref:Uncharacterized protein n=1 Tax=Clostridioides difficile TaxID=1496 RepID=A0A069A878_CLODI|nr:hypothetical protein BN1096_610005 [Clostridioides difficile]